MSIEKKTHLCIEKIWLILYFFLWKNYMKNAKVTFKPQLREKMTTSNVEIPLLRLIWRYHYLVFSPDKDLTSASMMNPLSNLILLLFLQKLSGAVGDHKHYNGFNAGFVIHHYAGKVGQFHWILKFDRLSTHIFHSV